MGANTAFELSVFAIIYGMLANTICPIHSRARGVHLETATIDRGTSVR
jgi:hypothetical protein